MTKISMTIVISMFVFASCKKFQTSSSGVKKFENQTGNICESINTEAKSLTETSQESLETIQLKIIQRERDILESLTQKASICKTKNDPTDVDCNLTLSNATEFEYVQKIRDLGNNCNIQKTVVRESDSEDLEDFEPSIEDLDSIEEQFSLLGPLNEESNNHIKTSARLKIIAKLTTYCAIAAKIVGLKSSQTNASSSSTLSSRTIRFCSSKPIQLMCSGLVVQANETLAALSSEQHNLFREHSKFYYKTHTSNIFNSDLKECIKGVKRDVTKKLAKEIISAGSKNVTESLFKKSIATFTPSSKSFLNKIKLAKSIAKIKTEICAFALGNLSEKITQVPHEEWSSSQSCLSAGKQGKERFTACLQTAHHVCNKIGGYVNLEDYTDTIPETEWEKILTGIGEFGVVAASSALPPLSIAVTGMVDEMSKGISSLFGDGTETNAFLECTVGPALRCVSANFTAWGLGIDLDDLKKPVDKWKTETSEPEYFVRDFCVCDRQCYIDDIGYDTPFGDNAHARYVVPAGDAGTRLCKTKQKSFYTGATKNGYQTYAYQDNCRTLKARVRTTGGSVYENAEAYSETVEVNQNGKWTKIFTPNHNIEQNSVSQQRTSLPANSLNPLYPHCL